MPAFVESGVYNVERGLPWHRLGTPNDGYMTAHQILCAAQLDWGVEKVPLYIHSTEVVYTQQGVKPQWSDEVPDNFGIVRQTDNTVLGVVGNRYEPAQNEEVLSFMDNIIGSGQAVYDTAWSLRGGKTVALTAELDTTSLFMPEGEEFRTYITFMNNHDGSGKIRGVVSPIRVVCMNTLAMAIKAARFTWERKHTQNWNSEASKKEAYNALGMAHAYQEAIATVAKELIVQGFNKAEFFNLASDLIIPKDAEKPTPQQITKMENIMALYTNSANLNNIRTTKWGALNAVAEFVDYGSSYRGKDKDDKRAESIVLGKGVDMKTKALELLVAA